MAHKPRTEMIAETRAKLVTAARKAFGTVGYAEASMDDFTAEAGLTRGALYHHFGDKKGLLQAVIAEIDGEMSARMSAVTRQAPSRWQGFVDECVTYVEMALDPEIQRIILRDGPAVLGDPSQWSSQTACIRNMTATLEKLIEERTVRTIDPRATAHILNGTMLYASLLIANAEDQRKASQEAVRAMTALLDGLLAKPEAA
ncbi:TetR/AcrR family transcriptional regulator [Aestuariivirga sp. YIM B02566]|uniref:TetR/AcrR family transcriptional regulator n=1 Tax=Taklimakanibacter albus TaxID=2800327 RepID=A0ACC5RBZ2_9HYPH|nr:TetR/AcrR family transcriptional regulator [Aestuariivirga sp. YIM B02566]MBK1870137.1 TetR/AcrR family transcriptional regulator [Aestuariivirga sp. YIM B02566]